MIVQNHQIQPLGGGGVLSIMHGLYKTGAASNEESRRKPGPGAYRGT